MPLVKKSAINTFLFLLICFSNIFGEEPKAENDKKEATKPATEDASKKPPAGPPAPPWWTNSAMVAPDDLKWKSHIETESKYTYQSGTLDSHLIESNVLFALRKNRFTNFAFADIGFMNADQHFAIYVPDENGVLGKKELSQKIFLRKYQFVDIFRTDFTKHLFMDLGYEWVRDDMSFIQARSTYFGGMGYQFDVNKKHHFSFIGGVGYEETDYTPRDVLETRGIPTSIVIEDTPNSAALFFQYKGSQQLSPAVSFHQSLFYTHYLEEDRVDRWELKLRVMYRLKQNLSFFTAYEANFEDNKTSNAAGGEKLNTKIVTGIRFSF